jgi:hypothetical protein
VPHAPTRLTPALSWEAALFSPPIAGMAAIAEGAEVVSFVATMELFGENF